MTADFLAASPHSLKPTLASARPASLQRALMARIALVALACCGLAVAVVLFEIQHETRQLETGTAERIARHLALQRLRIDSNLDVAERFPDWDIVIAHVPAGGQCVRFVDDSGETLRGDCVGSLEARSDPPAWFRTLHMLLFGSPTAAAHPVVHRGESHGTVLVSTDRAVEIARAWREVRQMLGLTALIVVSLCLLSWFAVGRALAPARAVVAGLDRLAGGDFGHRLPAFRHAELQRIGEVANQLAGTIEATLAERALLSQRLVDAQERERRHLARELHDEFGQNLAAVAALAAAIERSAAEADGEVRAELRDEARSLSRLAARMMTALRGTLEQLRPADLDGVGLAESLRQLVELWNRGGGARFALEAAGAPEALPDTVAVQLYRIAQEALTNAARHAGARSVRLTLERVAGVGVRLTIDDDGVGRRRNLEEGGPGGGPGGGRGLLNMRERVAALGGAIAFEDRTGGGLRVRVTIPLGTGA